MGFTLEILKEIIKIISCKTTEGILEIILRKTLGQISKEICEVVSEKTPDKISIKHIWEVSEGNLGKISQKKFLEIPQEKSFEEFLAQFLKIWDEVLPEQLKTEVLNKSFWKWRNFWRKELIDGMSKEIPGRAEETSKSVLEKCQGIKLWKHFRRITSKISITIHKERSE